MKFPNPLPYEFKFRDGPDVYTAKRLHGDDYSVDTGTGFDEVRFKPEYFEESYRAIEFYFISSESEQETQLRNSIRIHEQTIEHHRRLIEQYEVKRAELEKQRLGN